MALPQVQAGAAASAQFEQSTREKVKIFRWLVGSLLTLIAATFVLMLWVVGSPDAYHEHMEAYGPSSKWPDGSAKTGQDWWAKAGGKPPTEVAQPPTSAAPPSGQSQPSSSNHG